MLPFLIGSYSHLPEQIRDLVRWANCPWNWVTFIQKTHTFSMSRFGCTAVWKLSPKMGESQNSSFLAFLMFCYPPHHITRHLFGFSRRKSPANFFTCHDVTRRFIFLDSPPTKRRGQESKGHYLFRLEVVLLAKEKLTFSHNFWASGLIDPRFWVWKNLPSWWLVC